MPATSATGFQVTVRAAFAGVTVGAGEGAFGRPATTFNLVDSDPDAAMAAAWLSGPAACDAATVTSYSVPSVNTSADDMNVDASTTTVLAGVLLPVTYARTT